MVDQTSEGFGEGFGRSFRPVARVMPPLPRPYSVETANEPKPRALRIAAGALGLVLLAWLIVPGLLADARRPAAPAPSAPLADIPAWNPLAGATPSFTLAAPMFPKEAVAFSARQHNTGGGREDVFAVGDPAEGGAHGRVVAYQPGGEARAVGTFFLEIARRAAEAGLAVARTELPGALPTRFGPAETAETVFIGEGGNRACLAFRLEPEGATLRLAGWLCGAGGRTDPAQLACLIDSLDLAPGNADLTLKAAFARKSAACQPPKPPSGRTRAM